jgi:BirA family transcriptional regulator, biotin operon repressor / biotin---[acetyl-CoA-carboxylase] ligase
MLRVLELLRRHREGWLSMEALGRAAGASPGQVHQRLEELRARGYIIEVVPARGYRLTGTPNSLSAELIEYGLETRYIGRKVLVYDATDSTNDVAWEYARERGYEGLAVFADQQRCGRGRLGRSWSATKGSSVLCSVLIRALEGTCGASLSLMGGLAAAEAIEKTAGITTGIKWPNDVLIDGRKAAGTMVESRRVNGGLCYVIGVGINCSQRTEDFPAELRERAASLGQAVGGAVDRVQLSQELLRRMDHWWSVSAEGDQTELHDAWLARCGDVGSRVTLACDGRRFSGRVIDVLVREGLLLQLDDGSVRIFDGATSSRADDVK